MKVGVTNAVLSNGGDAAICASIKLILERDLADQGERIEVVVFDSNADVTSERFPEWTVYQQLVQAPPRPYRPWFIGEQILRTVAFWIMSTVPGALGVLARIPGVTSTAIGRSLSALSSCDIVVSTGGTYLVDNYDFTHRLVELRCARALGKPIVLWTQSMGPFRSWRARGLAKRIAANVDGVYCRDARSANHWRQATAYRGPVAVAPDAAFALEVPSTRLARGVGGGDLGPRAALSVRAWNRGVEGDLLDRSQYESTMRSSITTLEQLGWRSMAISTCQGLPDYAYDDSAVARRIFHGQDVEIDEDFRTPYQLLEVLSTCQLVVTTRMHMAILAILAQVPVVAIAYEFKTVELFQSIGLAHAVIKIEDVSPEWMNTTTRRAVDDPEQFRLNHHQLAELREGAALPAVLVRKLAGGSKAPGG